MSESKKVLLAAFSRLLKPLVRILLRNDVSFSDFSEVSKAAFVEAGRMQAEQEGSPATAREISARTGIDPWEVEQVIAGLGGDQTSSDLGRITRLLSGWHTDSEFTGPYGLPLELPIETARGDERSFFDLVSRYCPGSSAEVLLTKLSTIGAVREVDGWVRVLTRTYLPKVDAPEGLERLGLSIQRFVETIDFNRQEQDATKRLFERTVYADDGIRVEDLGRFKSYVRERAQLLTEDIDNWLSQLEPPASGDRVINTGLGIYHYVDESQGSDGH